MRFFCYYTNDNLHKEVFIKKAVKEDVHLIKEWLDFHESNPPIIEHWTEKCNACLMWDVCINNIKNIKEDVFKITSIVSGKERLEGLISLNIDNNKNVVIEALEVAPWNRTIYKQENRDFRMLGLILIGFAITYGNKNNFRGIIKLQSLEVRETYYKNGLNMHETPDGYFQYYDEECSDFIEMLRGLEFLYDER